MLNFLENCYEIYFALHSPLWGTRAFQMINTMIDGKTKNIIGNWQQLWISTKCHCFGEDWFLLTWSIGTSFQWEPRKSIIGYKKWHWMKKIRACKKNKEITIEFTEAYSGRHFRKLKCVASVKQLFNHCLVQGPIKSSANLACEKKMQFHQYF